MRKNNRAARAARFLLQLDAGVCQMQHLRFWQQREPQAENLSFFHSTYTLKPLHFLTDATPDFLNKLTFIRFS